MENFMLHDTRKSTESPALETDNTLAPRAINKLEEENRELKRRLQSEEQFNDMMLSFIREEHSGAAKQDSALLGNYAKFFQADFCALYSYDHLQKMYEENCAWSRENKIGANTFENPEFDPLSYHWAFSEVKSGKIFTFKRSMLESLQHLSKGADPSAKAWLESKINDCPEYHLCKMRGWSFFTLVPCIYNDDVLSVVLLGFQGGNRSALIDNEGRMLSAASFLTRAILQIKPETNVPAHNPEILKAFENIEYAVVLTDPEGRISLVNPAFFRLLGVEEYDIFRLSFDGVIKLYANESGKALQSPFEDLKKLASGKDNSASFFTINHANEERNLNITCTAVWDTEHDISGYLIIIQDVTQKQKDDMEKIKTYKLEAVSSLSAGLAHDFNNILTAILANISLAMDDLPENSELYGLLKAAEDSTNKGKLITDHLLTFANGRAAKPTESETKALLVQIVDEVLAKTQINVHYQFEQFLPPINIPADAFSKAIKNILYNSMQAMSPDGNLTIRGIVQTNDVLLHIIDDGEGIESHNLPHVFIPYWTTREGSSGLGLTAVYSILKKYNAKIEISSVYGRGTDVKLLIPIAVHQDSPPVIEEVANTETKNIIILMDDSPFRKAMIDALRRMSYNLLPCANPEDMMSIFEDHRLKGDPINTVVIDYDFVSSDCMQSYVEKLQSSIPLPKLMALLSKIGPEDIKTYRKSGFAEIIAKPYHLSEVPNLTGRYFSLKTPKN